MEFGKVSVFLLSYYEGTLYGLSHIPAEEVHVHLPAIHVDAVSAERMAVPAARGPARLVLHRTPVVFPRPLDPVRVVSGSPSLNSFYVYRNVRELLDGSEWAVTIEPHTLYSSQIIGACRQTAIRSLVTSESSPDMATSRVPPYSALARRSVRLADRLMACTDRAHAMFAAFGADPAKVLAHQVNCIDLTRFHPRAALRRPDAPVNVLFVGRASPHKGLPTVLAAMDRLSRSWRVALTVVGRGPLEPELHVDRGYPITHLPFLPTTDYAEVFRSADIFTLPSQPVRRGPLTVWEEAYGVAAIQAKASGLPLVLSDCGNLPSVAAGRNPVVPANDPTSLAGALGTLIDDPTARSAIGRANAREMAELFDPVAVEKRWRQAMAT